MADFGYDVSDYCDVDPLFGDLADFDALVADAHALGLRVVIDWVPNHTSDRHPWFADAASSRTSAHRDWYVWRDPRPDGSPPNNWVAAFDLSAPAWTLHEPTGQWYLHLFEAAQPDLDWDQPAVVEAMHDMLRFWLDRGVDGFRADVVHCIGKDPALPDDPPEVAGIPHCALNDVPVTHERLRALRRLIDAYPGERMMVGEVFLLSTEAVATYYGDGRRAAPRLQLPSPVRAVAGRPVGGLHPRDRARARSPWGVAHLGPLQPRQPSPPDPLRPVGGAGGRGRGHHRPAAARPGPGPRPCSCSPCGGPRSSTRETSSASPTPMVPAERRVDPGGRDGCRAPLPWDGWCRPRVADPGGHGALAPLPPEADIRNRSDQRADPGSILHLYRRLLRLRHLERAARGRAPSSVLELPEGALGYRRAARRRRRRVGRAGELHRPDGGPRVPDRAWDGGTVVLCSTGTAAPERPFGGMLGPRPGRRRALLSPDRGLLRSKFSCQKSSAPRSPSDIECSCSWPLWRMQHTNVPIHGPLSMQWTAPHRRHCGSVGSARSSRSKSSS